MRHKYLPLLPGGVLLGAGAALALACSDATGPGAGGPHLLLDLEVPPSDSLTRLAIALTVARSDSALLSTVNIFVDSAAGVQPQSAATICCSGRGTRYQAVVNLPGPGRHTITVVATDTLGRAVGASAAWTVRVPDVRYSVAPLPDSGAGGNARFVHANGTATGWVAGASGVRRPAVWRGGALTVVGATDSLHGAATRVNAIGDVLIEYRAVSAAYATNGSYVRVHRADGAMITMPAVFYSFPTTNGGTSSYPVCCSAGADLTESRLALGTTAYYTPYGYSSAVLDVVRGVRADSMVGVYTGLNDAGQAAGSVTSSGLYMTTSLVTRGFTAARLPEALVASVCDRVGRYYTLAPLDLDDSGNLLASYCGNPVWLPTGATTASRWLDRMVGRSRAIHLSRQGQLIASLDSTGTIYLWRPSTDQTTRVRLVDDAWRIDSLGAVNASGVLAAYGIERATGRTAALLLTPSAAP